MASQRLSLLSPLLGKVALIFLFLWHGSLMAADDTVYFRFRLFDTFYAYLDDRENERLTELLIKKIKIRGTYYADTRIDGVTHRKSIDINPLSIPGVGSPPIFSLSSGTELIGRELDASIVAVEGDEIIFSFPRRTESLFRLAMLEFSFDLKEMWAFHSLARQDREGSRKGWKSAFRSRKDSIFNLFFHQIYPKRTEQSATEDEYTYVSQKALWVDAPYETGIDLSLQMGFELNRSTAIDRLPVSRGRRLIAEQTMDVSTPRQPGTVWHKDATNVDTSHLPRWLPQNRAYFEQNGPLEKMSIHGELPDATGSPLHQTVHWHLMGDQQMRATGGVRDCGEFAFNVHYYQGSKKTRLWFKGEPASLFEYRETHLPASDAACQRVVGNLLDYIELPEPEMRFEYKKLRELILQSPSTQ